MDIALLEFQKGKTPIDVLRDYPNGKSRIVKAYKVEKIEKVEK